MGLSAIPTCDLLAVLHRFAHTFFQMSEILSVLGMIGRASKDPSRPVEHVVTEQVLENFRKISNLCRQVGLSLSVTHADRVLSIHRTGLTYGQLKEAVTQLQDRLRDELDSVYFLHVSFDKARMYYDDNPFGEAVSRKFSKAITDIQEASKCLAVGRFTACVFHLMRVMEIGVQRLGRKLGTPNPETKEWHKILNDINGAIKKLSNPTTPITAKQKAVRDKYAQAAALLENVKNAWRNNVMHPKETYTEEEAEQVFRSVKDYMQHLAKII